ncbi:MAG: hypothetical protein K2H01_06645 [Ruminococcus sp.]|nr:hypothetical protein [Ruminococcus sp.]
MEKSKISITIFIAAFTFMLIETLTNGFLIFKGIHSAVMVCLETMIPSLYAMMILSELFISCGFHRKLGRFFNFPARCFFKSTGQILVIFLFSQAAGYPIGARMLENIREDSKLTKKQASILSGVCFGGGPAFIAALFAEKKEDAAAVFFAGLISNFIVFIIISRFIHIENDAGIHNLSIEGSFAEIITNSAVKSGKALLKICAMIIMFGGIFGLLKMPFLMNLLDCKYSGIILSIFEISNISNLFPYSRAMLPYIGASLSFGGICVFMQLAAITKGKINIGYIFFIRIITAIITGALLYFREIFIPPKTEIVSAVFTAENMSIDRYAPLPSILLLVMTIMLLINVDKKNAPNKIDIHI